MLYKYIAHRPWLQLCILFVLMYGLNLVSPRDFWVQDEMRYAEVVREMLDGGSWLVPHLNGFPYPDKPALYFWIVAWIGKLVVHGEMSFRLVSALSTLLAGVGVYKLGNAIAGKPIGFLASIIFGSTLLTIIVGQIMRMDMLLTAICVFAWLNILQFDQTQKSSSLMIFWALCLFSLAIKGPIALIFNVLPAFVWFFSQRGMSGLKMLRPLFGMFSILGLVAVWVFAVYQSNQSAYLSTIWHQQLVGRTINSWSHKEPFYFYIILLPLLLMPWTGLIVKGYWQLFRHTDKRLTEKDWPSVVYFSLVFSLIFSVVPLMAVSLVSGKLFIYLEPLIPAMALVGAVSLRQTFNHPKKVNAWFSWPPVFFLIGSGVLIASGFHQYLPISVSQSNMLAITLVILGVLCGCATWLSPKKWFYSIVAVAVVLSCLLFTGMTTMLNPLFSARLLGDSIQRLAMNDRPVAVVNATRGILNYYANRTMTELNKNAALPWLAQHPDGVMIIRTKDLKASFADKLRLENCVTHEMYTIEFKEYHVLASCSIK